MKFRNYCIVVMGDTLGVQAEIQKISETTPNVLDAKGILISTFSSLVELNELKEWFQKQKISDYTILLKGSRGMYLEKLLS